jgi:hypothetical protein
MSGTLQTDEQTGGQTENIGIGRVRRDRLSDRHKQVRKMTDIQMAKRIDV